MQRRYELTVTVRTDSPESAAEVLMGMVERLRSVSMPVYERVPLAYGDLTYQVIDNRSDGMTCPKCHGRDSGCKKCNGTGEIKWKAMTLEEWMGQYGVPCKEG